MSKMFEGKYYCLPMGEVRQAFSNAFLEGDNSENAVVGIDVDISLCPKYWYGQAMMTVDPNDAYIAIERGLNLNLKDNEEIIEIFYIGDDDDDVCYIMIG